MAGDWFVKRAREKRLEIEHLYGDGVNRSEEDAWVRNDERRVRNEKGWCDGEGE